MLNSFPSSVGQLNAFPLAPLPPQISVFATRSDADGRERYFHGTNCVVKGPPYHPDPDNFDTLVSLTDRDFALLADAGMNVIRLGVMWPGVEPQPGQYNYTYLGVISRIAAGAAKHGIYTLLDMHQARARWVFHRAPPLALTRRPLARVEESICKN